MPIRRDLIRALAFAAALGVICGRAAWTLLHGPGPATTFTAVAAAMFVGFAIYWRILTPLRARARTAWEAVWIDVIVGTVWIGPWAYLFYHFNDRGQTWAGFASMVVGGVSGPLIFQYGRRSDATPK